MPSAGLSIARAAKGEGMMAIYDTFAHASTGAAQGSGHAVLLGRERSRLEAAAVPDSAADISLAAGSRARCGSRTADGRNRE